MVRIGDDRVYEHIKKCYKDGKLGKESPPATEGGWENRLSLNYRGDLCAVAVVYMKKKKHVVGNLTARCALCPEWLIEEDGGKNLH